MKIARLSKLLFSMSINQVGVVFLKSITALKDPHERFIQLSLYFLDIFVFLWFFIYFPNSFHMLPVFFSVVFHRFSTVVWFSYNLKWFLGFPLPPGLGILKRYSPGMHRQVPGKTVVFYGVPLIVLFVPMVLVSVPKMFH